MTSVTKHLFGICKDDIVFKRETEEVKVYLKSFHFPSEDVEWEFIRNIKRMCYDTFYPFKVLSRNGLHRLDFSPITILYGGNGSGKSTALNVIGQKLNIPRSTRYNRSCFFEDYLSFCEFEKGLERPRSELMITSDDVFDYMLDMRALNEGIDHKREETFQTYLDTKYSDFKFQSMADYDQLKLVNQTRRKTQSKFVRSQLMDNVVTGSNGENAYRFFQDKIKERALVLLDEPENSLSPKKQIELVQFIEESVRFFGCQFIIATHSPFILSLKEAQIVNLDAYPVQNCKWTDLENVRTYFDFFNKHAHKF